MAKEELIQFEGLVTEILPDARYRVQLDAGHEIVAYTAGKMKKNRIKTLAGDRVTIEMSPYDLEKGRLIFRHKDERPGSWRRSARCTAARPVPPQVSAGPRFRFNQNRGPLSLWFLYANRHQLRAKMRCKSRVAKSCRCAGNSLLVANPVRTKNRARQDCFGGLFRIM